MSAETFWTPERVEQLRAMIVEGLPYSEIGDRMGASKNMVLSKANRTGLATLHPDARGPEGPDPPPVGAKPAAAPPRPLPPTHPLPPKTETAPESSRPRMVARKRSAPPKSPDRRAEDADTVAKFLAERGATIIMSPEQCAQFLRDAGHACTIVEGDDRGNGAATTSLNAPVRRPVLDGRQISMAELYAAANALRKAAGLSPVEAPRS